VIQLHHLSQLCLASTGVLRTECPFFVYLHYRESEFNKEGKDWKFGLILAVHAALNREGNANLGTHAEVR